MIADPREPGAESGAPPSLEVDVDQHEVRFVVQGPWTGTARRQVTGVKVDPFGVTFLPGAARRLRWDEVGRVGLHPADVGAWLVVRDEAGDARLMAPCAGSSDDAWLAAYIAAQRNRHRPDDEQRARSDGALDDLAQLVEAIGMDEPDP